jgi:CheY-like chemotaxis protein
MDSSMPFKGRVLIAEDNEDLRDLMALQLAKLGVETLLAGNGAEALALASSEVPDLILLDVEMPILDGLEVARRLRANGFNGSIVAVSANRDSDSLRELRAAGCDDAVDKPVRLEELRALLSARLGPATRGSGDAS